MVESRHGLLRYRMKLIVDDADASVDTTADVKSPFEINPYSGAVTLVRKVDYEERKKWKVKVVSVCYKVD